MLQDPVQNKKSIRVPDLPLEIYKDQAQGVATSTSNPPPCLSTTEHPALEKENNGPSYIRSTMYTTPASEFALESCAMPFSIVATPFSEKGCIQFTCGYDTCAGCRSYFNHFTQRDQAGVICNICGQKSTAPLNYPENLGLAHFEYVVSASAEKSHCSLQQTDEPEYPPVKTLLSPIFVFMFDLGSAQLVYSMLDTVMEIVQNENFQVLYQNIGFFVINSGITAFNVVNGRLVRCRMPGEQPFISKRCVVPTKCTDLIASILDEIRKIQERTPPDAETVLSTLRHVSSFSSGCKVALVTASTMEPNYESLLSNVKNCNINLFRLCADKNSLLKEHPTLERVAFYTSGLVFKYVLGDLSFLRKDLRNLCLAKSVFDVRLIMKVSDNMFKASFVGSTLDDGLASSHLCHMGPSTTVLFNLGLNGPSKQVKYAQVNAAFTDFDGSRRMRVFNISFPTGAPSYVFSAISFDTLFAALVKLNVSEDANIEKMMVDSLIYYRSRCSTNASSSQFVLPESIKCLPVLIQSYLKKTDIEKSKLINAAVEQNLRYFYPRLFSLSEFVMSPSLEQTKNLRLSVNSITEDDIYILENSEKILIYIPRGVDRRLVGNLFEESEGTLTIRESEEEECAILNRIICELQAHYGYEMNVVICLAGEHISEAEFLMNMVEDKMNSHADYVDYIFKIHFDVQRS